MPHVNEILYIDIKDSIFDISVDGHGNQGNTGAVGPQGPAGANGLPGTNGTNGTNGVDGAPGVGVPTGGTIGQVLAKNSDNNFDTEWVDQSGGSVDIIQDDTAVLAPYESKVISHASDPLFKRIVEVLIPYVTNLNIFYNQDTESNYDYNPDEVGFDGQSAFLAPSYGALGMVADYIFKDNEVKDVFNSHDGINYNATFSAGIVDNALNLNGTSSYVDIPNHADLYIVDPQTHAIGIEFWIKTTATDGDVIGLWNETDNRRSWRIYFQGGALHFDLSSDGINADLVSTPFPSGILNDGNWHHVGFYLDNYSGWGGRYYLVYKDGNQYGIPGLTGMGSYPLYQNIIDPIRIGALGGASASNFLTAELAELAIYKNFDLTNAYGMYSSYFQVHYNTNIMGNHLSAYSLNRTNITTATSIDTSDWTYINSIYANVNNYGNAVVSLLFSVDGKATWKMWDGSAWQTALATDEGTHFDALPTTRTEWDLLFVAGTLDIIVQLKTNDPTYNPDIASIYFVYGKAGYMTGVTYINFALISDTETEISNITNIMNGEQTFYNIKTNILL